MKRFALVLLLCLAAPLRASAQQQQVPEIPYDSVPNLLKLPADLYLGEAAGVAVNSEGHIFVFTRSGRTQLLEFDPNGKFVREIGKDLYGFSFAHVVRVDRDDNIWCVDEGANMVIEFNPEGRVVLVFGRKPEGVEGAAAPPAPRRRLHRPLFVRSLNGSSTGQRMSPGMLPATASSATGTETRASSSTTKTETG